MDGGYDLQKQFPEVDRRLVGEPTEHDVRHFFSCSSAALLSVGLLYPCTAAHHDDMPSMSLCPFSNSIYTPSALLTG